MPQSRCLCSAQALKPVFELTPESASAVAAICVRFDGLPLAIELVAARIKMLTPQAILGRLTSSLTLLTYGPHDLPERQQTMRNAIAWGYELLGSSEQRLFRRLAVFVDGWTLEAAEAVCSDDEAPAADVLDHLSLLVDASLVVSAEVAIGVTSEIRFHFLELIHEFAREQLVAHDEIAVLRRRHAECYLALADQAEPEMRGKEQHAWYARLSGEHGNFRAALLWAEETEAVELGLRMTGALWWFWYVRGQWREGREWLEHFLSLQQSLDGTRARKLRADAIRGAGEIAASQREYGSAVAFLEESRALYRSINDERGVAYLLNSLGLIADERGEYERAVSLFQESLAAWRGLGDMVCVSGVLNNLANIAYRQGGMPKRLSSMKNVSQCAAKLTISGAPPSPSAAGVRRC
jgi:tetratricopeptide (TPR) repeat protein